MYHLFLDDIRDPKDAFLHRENAGLLQVSQIPSDNWEIVRSYEDFTKILHEKGLPETVSFDCDLCEEHMKHYMNHTLHTDVYEWENFDTFCGIHCAKYLQFLLKEDTKITIFIHSANHIGRKIIEKIFACGNV